MIVFDLDCEIGHRFEGWFRNREDFADQAAAGIIECPVCGSAEIKKGFSAPHLSKGRAEALPPAEPREPHSANAPALPAKLEAELKAVFAKIRKHVESTCDYVGDRFPEEARRMHYGETEPRGIYGEASLEETAELVEEGIEVMPLPSRSAKDDA